MFLGTCLAWGMPDLLLALFDASKQMLDIGIPAIRIIGLCFGIGLAIFNSDNNQIE